MRPLHLIGICICIWFEVHGRFGVLAFKQPSCMGRVEHQAKGLSLHMVQVKRESVLEVGCWTCLWVYTSRHVMQTWLQPSLSLSVNPLICTCKPWPDLLCSLCPAHPVLCMPFSTYLSFFALLLFRCCPHSVFPVLTNQLRLLPLAYILLFPFCTIDIHLKPTPLPPFLLFFLLLRTFHTLFVVSFLMKHFTSHVHIPPSSFLSIKANPSLLAPQPYHRYRQPRSQSLLSTPLYHRPPHIRQLTTTH